MPGWEAEPGWEESAAVWPEPPLSHACRARACQHDVDSYISLPEEVATDLAGDLVTYYTPSEIRWASYEVIEEIPEDIADAPLPSAEGAPGEWTVDGGCEDRHRCARDARDDAPRGDDRRTLPVGAGRAWWVVLPSVEGLMATNASLTGAPLGPTTCT